MEADTNRVRAIAHVRQRPTRQGLDTIIAFIEREGMLIGVGVVSQFASPSDGGNPRKATFQSASPPCPERCARLALRDSGTGLNSASSSV